MGQVILQALGNLFTVQNLIFANIGIFIGIIFGAIPGMNGNLAITVLLPFTFQMDTVPALLLLTAIFFGANFGGSISSILINTPGTNAAAATLIDGYPMCKNGQPRRALDMALTASTFGGFVSALCLLFFCTTDQQSGNEVQFTGVFCTGDFWTFRYCISERKKPCKRSDQRWTWNPARNRRD